MNNQQMLKYSCPKCGNKQYEIGEMWTIGSFWTRLFEFHNRRFTFVSCMRCHYTDFFKVTSNKIGEVYNLLSK